MIIITAFKSNVLQAGAGPVFLKWIQFDKSKWSYCY